MIKLHSTGLHETTVLSNLFIDRYMPKANGEFVKVYIYLLRMLGRPEEAFGLSQMADSLFCTEGDILRALKYWENEKLVSLLYEGTELTGITLLAPRNETDMQTAISPKKHIMPVFSGKSLPRTIQVSLNQQTLALRTTQVIHNSQLMVSPFMAQIRLSPQFPPSPFPNVRRSHRTG